MNYYIEVLRKYAVFSGRANRAEYWYFVLFSFLIGLALAFFDNILFSEMSVLGSLYSLVIFIPSLAVSVRRLHDINKSGWMLLVSFIPVIGFIWLLILMATKGQAEENQYGPSPVV